MSFYVELHIDTVHAE